MSLGPKDSFAITLISHHLAFTSDAAVLSGSLYLNPLCLVPSRVLQAGVGRFWRVVVQSLWGGMPRVAAQLQLCGAAWIPIYGGINHAGPQLETISTADRADH